MCVFKSVIIWVNIKVFIVINYFGFPQSDNLEKIAYFF